MTNLNCNTVRLKNVWTCLLLLAWLAMPLHALPAPSSNAPAAGTAPFILDDNRVFVELAFVRPDWGLRKALAFVDLGTPAPMISKKLRQELQIDQGKPLRLRLGALEIPVDPSTVQTGGGSFLTGPDGKATIPVEAVLPGSVMKDYQVVLDYARRTLTLARPGTLRPRGVPVPCRVNEKTGLISVAAVIGGDTYAMAVDSGSAYSWVRDDVAQQWVQAHPGWKHGTGAVGEANMQTREGGAEARATILRLPEIRLGPLRLEQIGALGIASEAPPFPPAPGASAVQGNFFDWYSKKAPEPVIGWLGGNVLKGFRLTIDFSRHLTYWERESALDPHDLDQVGVTLETRDKEKGYFIAGIAEKNGKPTVDGVRVGDKLLQIGDLRVDGATRGAIFSALHGKPGASRVLVVERAGRQLTLPVKISSF